MQCNILYNGAVDLSCTPESESNHNFVSCSEAWRRRRSGFGLHKKSRQSDPHSDAGKVVNYKEDIDLEDQEDWKFNDDEV